MCVSPQHARAGDVACDPCTLARACAWCHAVIQAEKLEFNSTMASNIHTQLFGRYAQGGSVGVTMAP